MPVATIQPPIAAANAVKTHAELHSMLVQFATVGSSLRCAVNLTSNYFTGSGIRAATSAGASGAPLTLP
jgi:hypothetical protein